MKVLITGASSGIGRDLAKEFAKINYNIVLVARSEEKLKKIKNELVKEYNIEVEYEVVDLSQRDSCQKSYERDLEKDMKIIDTDIIAMHILTKLYLKDMKEKNNGKILNVASIAGFLPGPLMATYYASKNYVVKLSEAIREELRKEKSNVKISILCPGPVRTNFNNVANVKFELNSLSSEYVAKYTVKQLLKNRFYIVPGFTIKCAKFFSKITPTPILARCTYHMQKRKDK